MKKSSYIRLVPGAKQTEINLDGLQELLQTYRSRMKKTGEQLQWDYEAAAFPYEIEKHQQDGITYLLLKGKDPSAYYYLVMGTGKEDETGVEYIQIVLPDRATHGDISKANEYAKFLAKEVQGELTMFNDRTMYFQAKR
ncbi:DUF1885 family protein [Risungbinella massiliensis]|uniref:DUF1885 family protein n=1 Tax=Risungbinella massiliensis TaxID=1329796 RepID=UPI0005CB947D|nr:DUF1885 family protein [Risungbinella massiliensis]